MVSHTVLRYSRGEEIANSITHGIGTVLAITALAVLTTFAALKGTAWHIVSCSIFGGTLIFQYAASTLYHSIPSLQAKNVLRILDHIGIVLLIAGTYTPFTLISLQGAWGWSLFAIIWTLASLGVIFELTSIKKYRLAMVSLYILMGWIVLIAIHPLSQQLEAKGLLLLLLGGVIYTVGVLFYVLKKIPYNHAIWHVFVMGGSALHFFAILFYVIPDNISP